MAVDRWASSNISRGIQQFAQASNYQQAAMALGNILEPLGKEIDRLDREVTALTAKVKQLEK